ncbi:GATA transcription factor 17-like isoform X1 [Amaranthus tricolor]|uniref:GATA transcription factor 17-like isoform X1 n=1 Tax=Amaranthus tricolor TaxID=29722 RepID=UPI00258DD529|nr:GATA transcription factor 17-like isoform X1 [Amaranthus tricolor]
MPQSSTKMDWRIIIGSLGIKDTRGYEETSLCNACGIRYRKRKMAEDKEPSSGIRRRDDYNDDNQMNESMKIRCSSYTDYSSSSSSCSPLKKQRSNNGNIISRNLGEVEQAAVLLMSMACDSIFA